MRTIRIIIATINTLRKNKMYMIQVKSNILAIILTLIQDILLSIVFNYISPAILILLLFFINNSIAGGVFGYIEGIKIKKSNNKRNS